jgi:hypothetical protein
MPSHHPMIRDLSRLLSLFTICGFTLLNFQPSAYAQTAITSWVLTNSDAADSTSYTAPGPITFQNQTNAVTGVTYGTTNAYIDPTVATAAYVRRSGVTGAAANNASIWEVQGTSTTNLRGLDTSAMTLNNVLMGNNALMGVTTYLLTPAGPRQSSTITLSASITTGRAGSALC